MKWSDTELDIGTNKVFEFTLLEDGALILNIEPSCTSCSYVQFTQKKIMGTMELRRPKFTKELIIKALVMDKNGEVSLEKLKVKAHTL